MSSKSNRPKGAQPNNKNGTKLKAPDIRQEAYKQYCDYLAKGLSKEGWYFEHPELTCTHKTMEKYIRENPLEFPPIQKEMAESKSYQVWEQRGIGMVQGLQEKCQPAIYQMFMRNKFGWDKESVDEVAECAADKILERLTQK